MFVIIYFHHGDHSDNTDYWKPRRSKAVEEALASTSKVNTYFKKAMLEDKNLTGEENPFISLLIH